MKQSFLSRSISAGMAFAILLAPGGALAQTGQQIPVDHSDCTFLGPKRESFVKTSLKAMGVRTGASDVAIATESVRSMIATKPEAQVKSFATQPANDTIDAYILQALQSNHIQPADSSDDYMFIRRVTLDLTGRIPTAARVRSFTADTTANKRAALIDELLAKPEWVDKFTMYFGDLYQNNASSQQTQRMAEGRNAFYKYIHDSLASNKPYDTMAKELIAAEGMNSFDQANGQMNWMLGGRVASGPSQDTFDQQATNVAEEFLGMTHVNCLLCHNGAGHLETLNLWASKTTRYQAWELASFMSRTWMRNIPIIDPANPQNKNNYYWTLDKYTTDYALNTTTGNRPSRLPVGTLKAVAPVYIFDGSKPSAGQDYRVALGGFVTKDFQFARATVNYMWAYFFGMGIVDPPDQFDLARLDPANPPPAPWTLQPSNPALLNALAQHFVASGYDLKSLMREITNSQTYQLSSEYNGVWKDTYEPFFARKFVRRLWAEEIHDGVVQATGVIPVYTVPNFSKDSTKYGVVSPGFGTISYAMQAPDVIGMPDGGQVSQFLDYFLRGDRDANPRRTDGSILQALGLMNDPFIENRIKQTVKGNIINNSLAMSDVALIDTLYMNVLSRHPTMAETAAGVTRLSSNRGTSAEDLLWALFNKVDFVFNY